MTVPAAHVAGVPVEEMLAAAPGVLAAAGAAATLGVARVRALLVALRGGMFREGPLGRRGRLAVSEEPPQPQRGLELGPP